MELTLKKHVWTFSCQHQTINKKKKQENCKNGSMLHIIALIQNRCMSWNDLSSGNEDVPFFMIQVSVKHVLGLQ